MRRIVSVIFAVLLAVLSVSAVVASHSRSYIPDGWPQRLIVPAIGVDANVEHVDLAHINDEHAPYKWSDVAWYSNWVKPGEPGNAQIYGHLDSYCCPAVFWKLSLLKPGDRINVTYPGNRQLTFAVQWVRDYPNTNLPLQFMFQDTGARGLLLLTCAGDFHRDGTGYDHKEIVYATLVVPNGVVLPAPAATPTPVPQSQLLARPDGVAVLGNGDLVVADTDNDRIQKLAPNGQVLASWGSTGSGDGQFSSPSAVAVDGSGAMYVADPGNDRIVKLGADGAFVTSFGTSGDAASRLKSPNGVAVDAAGNVFVADSGHNRIVKFSPSGALLAAWDTTPGRITTFDMPDSVAVDAAGHVWVADTGNGRVVELSSMGQTVRSWQVKRSARQVLTIEGIAVDGQGNVYVVGPDGHVVFKYSAKGRLLTRLGQTAKKSKAILSGPGGLAVDRSGNVYVADTGNDRIVELTAKGAIAHAWR